MRCKTKNLLNIFYVFDFFFEGRYIFRATIKKIEQTLLKQIINPKNILL